MKLSVKSPFPSATIALELTPDEYRELLDKLAPDNFPRNASTELYDKLESFADEWNYFLDL